MFRSNATAAPPQWTQSLRRRGPVSVPNVRHRRLLPAASHRDGARRTEAGANGSKNITVQNSVRSPEEERAASARHMHSLDPRRDASVMARCERDGERDGEMRA
uniref:Uncharacterized protein n=1 Tax=Knipowitschia caucasica TaxID=637954 RepID=A0AAV2KX14_KNICA